MAKGKLFEITTIPKTHPEDTLRGGKHLAYIKGTNKADAFAKYANKKRLPPGTFLRVFDTDKPRWNPNKKGNGDFNRVYDDALKSFKKAAKF